jgi:hypothetical protein
MNDGVVGQVEDIYPVGGGVVLDRGWVFDWLQGVRKMEEKLGRLREVLDLGGQGERGEDADGGELDREAVGEEILYEGDNLWAGESYEEGGAKSYTATIEFGGCDNSEELNFLLILCSQHVREGGSAESRWTGRSEFTLL